MNEVKVLTEQGQIEKAKRLLVRARFSVFYRKLNTENYESELQALEKIYRFLTSENNQGFIEKSNMWKGMLEQINKHKTEYQNAIKLSNERSVKELEFLEEVESNVIDNNEFDYDYFTNLMKYADNNGDTDEFDESLTYMLKKYGFLGKEEKEEENETAVWCF